MLKKLKEFGLSIGLLGLVALPVLAPATAYADFTSNQLQNKLCQGTNADTDGSSGNCDDTTGGGTNLEGIMRKVIQVFSIIVGFVAVVMIIVGGIKYITSGGDSGNISGAKNTIVYAIIGLIIVALAQVLVHFVLKNVTGASIE